MVLLAVMGCRGLLPQPTTFTPRSQVEGAVYLVRSGAATELVDTGPAFRSHQLIRWLREQGVNRLDAVWLATPSIRQTGAAPDLAAALPVTEWRVAPEALHTRSYQAMVEDLRSRGETVRVMRPGDTGRVAGELIWEVVHPPPGMAVATMRESALAVRWMEEARSWMHVPFLSPELLYRLAGGAVLPAADVLLAGRVEDPADWPEEWWRMARPEVIWLRREAQWNQTSREWRILEKHAEAYGVRMMVFGGEGESMRL